MEEFKFFAALRIKGEYNGRGFYKMEALDFVDINIFKEEAERIVKFLSTCLDNERVEDAKTE